LNDSKPQNIEPNQSNPARILVIDDEGVVCLSCSRILSQDGYHIKTIQNPRLGLEKALTESYDVILLDIVMQDIDGLEILKQIKLSGVFSEIVMMTGYSTVETAVQAMKLGAADYISKPFTPDEMRVVVKRVLERSALIQENIALRKRLEERNDFEGMLGESQAMEKIYSMIQRVAHTDGTVLVTGESGTGKELAARAIHKLSPRCKEAFIPCDCSTLTPSLLESELFGHVKGSFSGAVSSKKGLFEAAHRGTLFLDELSNISLETQGKLLRVLETHKVKKVGDASETDVDIRLIGATNRDLYEMIENKEFREDLFYRINVVPIYLPPLRERKGDILLLMMHFLERFKKHNAIDIQGFSEEAIMLMESYKWQGNVRELKNIVERLAILCTSDRITPADLPPEILNNQTINTPSSIPVKWEDFKEYKKQVRDAAVQDIERSFLLQSLERNDYNVSKTAEDVGMQRTQLHALVSKYGLQGNS